MPTGRAGHGTPSTGSRESSFIGWKGSVPSDVEDGGAVTAPGMKRSPVTLVAVGMSEKSNEGSLGYVVGLPVKLREKPTDRKLS